MNITFSEASYIGANRRGQHNLHKFRVFILPFNCMLGVNTILTLFLVLKAHGYNKSYEIRNFRCDLPKFSIL